MGCLYEKLERFHDKTGGMFVFDSAFDNDRYPFLVHSAQDKTHAESPEYIKKIRQSTSVRQATEWSMRMSQGSFPRMKYRFIYEERGERKLMIILTVLLFDLRTKLVGLQQIQTVFMPFLSVEVQSFVWERFNFYFIKLVLVVAIVH